MSHSFGLPWSPSGADWGEREISSALWRGLCERVHLRFIPFRGHYDFWLYPYQDSNLATSSLMVQHPNYHDLITELIWKCSKTHFKIKENLLTQDVQKIWPVWTLTSKCVGMWKELTTRSRRLPLFTRWATPSGIATYTVLRAPGKIWRVVEIIATVQEQD